jgi:ABC-type transport system substrate-binding protein
MNHEEKRFGINISIYTITARRRNIIIVAMDQFSPMNTKDTVLFRSFVLLSILLSSIIIPFVTIGLTFRSANGQQVSSGEPFRMTLPVPPNSLNELTIASGTSGYYIVELELAGASPVVLPNGSFDEFQSLTKWVTHNSNYTHWVFDVNTNLRWSDGTNASAADILATFGPKFGFIPEYDIWGIGPEVAAEYQINNSAAAYNLTVLDAHFGDKFVPQVFTSVYPASFVNSGGANSSNFGTDKGIGPFYVYNYAQGSFQMVMKRNPYFVPLPPESEIDINFVDSLSLTTTYLLSGSTDLAPVEPSNAQSILKNPSLGIIDEKGFGISTLEYNDSVYPYNMTQFRQALAYGINQSEFIDQAFSGYGLTAYNAEGIVSPVSTTWYDPNIQKYAYNTTQSLDLLREIGITKGSDGYLHYSNGSIVTLSLWADTDNTQDTVGAGVVQQNLQALGFKVNLVTTSVANIISDYSGNINNVRDAMILYSNSIPVWGSPYLDTEPGWNVYWITVQSNPYWEYPPYEDMLYQNNLTAFRNTDVQSQEKIYVDNIETLNAEYLPTLVLAYPDTLWGYNTAHWSNWNVGYIDFGAEELNWTALTNLKYSGSAVSSTSCSSCSSTTSTSISTSITAVSGPASYIIAAAAVVIVIGISGGAIYFIRARRTRRVA